MSDPIIFQAILDKKVMVDGLTAYNRRRSNWIACILVAAVLSLLTLHRVRLSSTDIGLLTVVPIVLILSRFVINPWHIARGLPRHLPIEQTCRFSDDGIEFSSNVEQSHQDWKAFWGLRESKGYFYLMYTSRVMVLLPKRGFRSEQDIDAFRALATRKLPPLGPPSEGASSGR
jgi:hypothetical protein